jgi:hypothetical protein
MRKKLDKHGTLTSPLGLTDTPTANWRSWGRFMFRPMAITLCLCVLIFKPETAYSSPRPVMEMKLYALNKFNNWPEFECYNELIFRESRWNPNAKNGSHYGLAQMRNAKVKDLNWREQIQWHLRYLSHRYQGSACKALNHLKVRGWH